MHVQGSGAVTFYPACCAAFSTHTPPSQNLCILIFTVSSGFIVSPANLGDGWLGAYYANPVTYLLQVIYRQRRGHVQAPGIPHGHRGRRRLPSPPPPLQATPHRMAAHLLGSRTTHLHAPSRPWW